MPHRRGTRSQRIGGSDWEGCIRHLPDTESGHSHHPYFEEVGEFRGQTVEDVGRGRDALKNVQMLWCASTMPSPLTANDHENVECVNFAAIPMAPQSSTKAVESAIETNSACFNARLCRTQL